ncbi:MAG: hypothetical protein QG588_224, partial [Candidatus Poribacteria bacterium]|nr:hypothetical protein [Candidatus Poribacteria bacterium]
LRTVRKNVLPPDKTMCRFSYNNVLYNATIMNRQLQVEKVGTFSSFSGASVEITNTSRNGWLDWEIRLPGDSKWQLSDTWRKSNVNL